MKNIYNALENKIDIIIYGALVARGLACFFHTHNPSPFLARAAVLQVIFQYSEQMRAKYPEPAKTINDCLSIFSLELLNFAPPECVNPGATFYDRLIIMTTVPTLAPPVIYAYFGLIKRDPNAGYKTLAKSLLFFKLILGAVTTTILQAFDCATIKGSGQHLKAQLTLNCNFHASLRRRCWVLYASIMTFVYPIGVPAVMLVVLGRNQQDINRLMTRVAQRGETVAVIIATRLALPTKTRPRLLCQSRCPRRL